MGKPLALQKVQLKRKDFNDLFDHGLIKFNRNELFSSNH